jgi:hypothetical protein
MGLQLPLSARVGCSADVGRVSKTDIRSVEAFDHDGWIPGIHA